MRSKAGFCAVIAAVLAAAAASGPAAAADFCVTDAWDTGNVDPFYLFPNWNKALVSEFEILLCVGCPGTTESLRGLTVVNFAGGNPADLSAVYCRASCGATDTGYLTMTYAGMFMESSGTYPAWTWAGANATDFSLCPDSCGGACGSSFLLRVYADVAPCPTPLDQVTLGFPVNSTSNTFWWGSIADNNDCPVPWDDMAGPQHTIVYAYKQGPSEAAPGDTIQYTLTYGLQGTTLWDVQITDTLPPYTHYVAGSAAPPPDPGFDPDPGPPPRLRWTIPAGLIAGGPTGQITYALTVDWGNGESFEPGSGDVAAPERTRLTNQAQVFFSGLGGCAQTAIVTPPVTTVVRRFLFWQVADNDVLFSQTYGQTPDEITYEVYVRNMSLAKTWWNVQVWESVPPELSTWTAAAQGFEDPCLGWTMTPSGCAAASPGWTASGAATLLTWTLDMPPAMTLSLRWKALVNATTPPGATAIGTAMILEGGRTRVVGGTGSSVVPRIFTEQVPIILPTTYVSYVAYAGGSPTGSTCRGFFMPFFPLNKKAQFELRGIEYAGAGWSTNGGVSDSIGCLIGDCLGGFPGNATCSYGTGVVYGGGFGGCRVERAPAKYDPTFWQTNCPTLPFESIYKITGNAPVLWQLLTYMTVPGDDYHTYCPAITRTYLGMTHYLWRAADNVDPLAAGYGTSLTLINTGADPNGNYVPAQPTTVHLFKWNFGNQAWDYQRTWEIDGESAAYDLGTLGVDDGPWRTISSDTQLIINQGMNTDNLLGCCCGGCANDFGHMIPTRETGILVSELGADTFYGVAQGFVINGYPKVVVGNCGAVDAKYEIWRYNPVTTLPPPLIPSQLAGTSGSWIKMVTETVPAGLTNANNPRIYSPDGPWFENSSLGLYKLKVLSGGPIQVKAGAWTDRSCAGGSMLHSVAGGQTGSDFWFNQAPNEPTKGGCLCGQGNAPGITPTQTLSFFCPKQGTTVNLVSGEPAAGGMAASYLTTGPDQCVSFTDLTLMSPGGRRNWHATTAAANALIGQYIQCNISQKGYTAPFLVAGTHYQIIAPPVVYLGQTFWITVVVTRIGGTTDTTYAGITSFTSTDRTARIENSPMDGYNYAWTGADQGVHVFVKVTLGTLGMQAIVGQDTVDGSINGLTTVIVVGADVKLTKVPPFQVAASGDVVQFKICWSNYSTATATTFTIADAVPAGMVYYPDTPSNHFCGATTGLGGATVAYSTTTDTPSAYATMTGPATTAVAYLKWTIPQVGVATTGCVCFKVTVN